MWRKESVRVGRDYSGWIDVWGKPGLLQKDMLTAFVKVFEVSEMICLVLISRGDYIII